MLEKTLQGPTSLTFLKISIPLVFLYCFNPFILRAQCISNNEIKIEAVCGVDGLAVLKGSIPKGGNGNYSYAWEINSKGNCSNNGFVPIRGATGAEYIIPKNSESEACYRRIVTSGNCKDESNKLNVKVKDLPSVSAPSAPKASAQSPQNCSQATGSITVTAVQGMQYSINGTQYQASNVFNNLQPGN